MTRFRDPIPKSSNCIVLSLLFGLLSSSAGLAQPVQRKVVGKTMVSAGRTPEGAVAMMEALRPYFVVAEPDDSTFELKLRPGDTITFLIEKSQVIEWPTREGFTPAPEGLTSSGRSPLKVWSTSDDLVKDLQGHAGHGPTFVEPVSAVGAGGRLGSYPLIQKRKTKWAELYEVIVPVALKKAPRRELAGVRLSKEWAADVRDKVGAVDFVFVLDCSFRARGVLHEVVSVLDDFVKGAAFLDLRIGIVCYQDMDAASDYLTNIVSKLTDVASGLSSLQSLQLNSKSGSMADRKAEALLDGVRTALGPDVGWRQPSFAFVYAVVAGEVHPQTVDPRAPPETAKQIASLAQALTKTVVVVQAGSTGQWGDVATWTRLRDLTVSTSGAYLLAEGDWVRSLAQNFNKVGKEVGIMRDRAVDPIVSSKGLDVITLLDRDEGLSPEAAEHRELVIREVVASKSPVVFTQGWIPTQSYLTPSLLLTSPEVGVLSEGLQAAASLRGGKAAAKAINALCTAISGVKPQSEDDRLKCAIEAEFPYPLLELARSAYKSNRFEDLQPAVKAVSKRLSAWLQNPATQKTLSELGAIWLPIDVLTHGSVGS